MAGWSVEEAQASVCAMPSTHTSVVAPGGPGLEPEAGDEVTPGSLPQAIAARPPVSGPMAGGGRAGGPQMPRMRAISVT